MLDSLTDPTARWNQEAQCANVAFTRRVLTMLNASFSDRFDS